MSVDRSGMNGNRVSCRFGIWVYNLDDKVACCCYSFFCVDNKDVTRDCGYCIFLGGWLFLEGWVVDNVNKWFRVFDFIEFAFCGFTSRVVRK